MADLKSINSVAAASLKSFNGVAAASLKSLLGLPIIISGWDVSAMNYANKSKDVSTYGAYPRGGAFSSDGTKMYIMGAASKTVYQYTLSIAWNVSTATYASKSKDVSAQETSPYKVEFSSDGTKMYIMGGGNKTVYQYTLSTAWDVSTATYASKSKDVSAQESNPMGVSFSVDGSKMYIAGVTNKTVYQYTLSTAWDVSTATYASKSKDVSAQDTYPHHVAFSADGTKMYIMGAENKTVYQYTLSTAWDVSTATYANKSKDVSAQNSSCYGISFSADGRKMYTFDYYPTQTVYQYSM